MRTRRTRVGTDADPDGGALTPLGDGPVATVLTGTDDTTGEAFALKVFPGPLDRRTRAGLDAERGRLRSLPPQVAVLLADRVEALPDGRCALRMELCAQSLPDLLASCGPLSVPDTLVLGTALATALTAVHRAGVVHGGVSGGNVLFRSSGEPVLSDVGATLRHAFPRDPLAGVEPTAPETIRDGTVDERSDLYGLGVVLHLALAGRAPHDGPPGEERGDRLLRVLGSRVPPLARTDAPPELLALVAELLATEPDRRPADASTVAGILDTIRRRAAPSRGQLASPHLPQAGAAGPDGTTPGGEDTAAGEPESSPEPSATTLDQPDGAAGADDVAFDDFAGATPSGPATRYPTGKPVLVLGPERPSRRTNRAVLLAGVAAVVALVTVAVLLVGRPAELTVPAPAGPAAASSPQPAPPGVVRLELSAATDRGDVVELSWRSSAPMDFAVVVAVEGERARILLARRDTSYRVPVDPVRKYCFRVQGSDGARVVQSEARSIRGANCLN